MNGPWYQNSTQHQTGSQYQLTAGGRRRFDLKTLQQPSAPVNRSGNFQSGQSQQEEAKVAGRPKGAIYCRVSSRKQKYDLERQVQALQLSGACAV